ncbi:MAG: hypothetical protein Q9163_002116 [Psora crenata]
MLNPHHAEDTDVASNTKWRDLILAQDLRRKNRVKIFGSGHIEDKRRHWQNLFNRAFVRQQNDTRVVDTVAADLCERGELQMVRFEFTPTTAHTEGILIDIPASVEGFGPVHERLRQIFSSPGDIRLYVFTAARSEVSFGQQYTSFTSQNEVARKLAELSREPDWQQLDLVVQQETDLIAANGVNGLETVNELNWETAATA